MKPLSAAVKPFERVAHQIGQLDPPEPTYRPPPPATSPYGASPYSAESLQGFVDEPVVTDWVRPPGALPESAFHDTCSRCGTCVNVCPVQCIKIDPNCIKGEGVPYIDVEAQPCVLCEGLRCMQSCPSGALVPTLLADIDMGTAVWNEQACLRSQGQHCTLCVDHCPVGMAALELIEGKIVVKEEGCTGCGVCQHACPTMPKSIIVTPKSARDRQHPN